MPPGCCECDVGYHRTPIGTCEGEYCFLALQGKNYLHLFIVSTNFDSHALGLKLILMNNKSENNYSIFGNYENEGDMSLFVKRWLWSLLLPLQAPICTKCLYLLHKMVLLQKLEACYINSACMIL